MRKSAEQFTREFFGEQERFNRKYYDVLLLPHLSGSNERLEKAKESEPFAIGIAPAPALQRFS